MNPQQFNQVFGAMAEAARNQAKEIDKATKNMKDMNAAVKDAEKRFKAASFENSALGKGMAFGSKAFGTLQVVMSQVTKAMDAYSKSAQIATDANLNSEQKQRLVAESIPIVGKWIESLNKFKNALDGTTAAMSRTERQINIQQGQIAAATQAAAQQQAARFQQIDIDSQTAGQNRAGFVRQEFGDTSTAQGQREYEYTLAQQPGELAGRRGQVELAAAKYRRDELAKREQDEFKLQQAQVEKFNANRQRVPGRAQEFSRLGDKVGTLGMMTAGEARMQDIILQKKKNVLDISKAESDIRKAGLQVEKARIGYLDQQLSLIKGQGTAFGGLTSAERQAALETVNIIKTQGFGAASEEGRALVGRAGGQEFLQNEFFKNAQNDPRWKEFQEGIGQRADFGGVQKERNEAQKRVLEGVQMDEKQLATDISDRMEAIFKKTFELIIARMETAFLEIVAKIQLANAQR